MFIFGLLGLAMPLLGLVLLAWAVLTIWRAVTLPRNTPREPVCEHCKYPVAGHIGVAGFTCPECGCDLMKVGITTPRMEATRRGSLAAALLAWTFLFGVGSYIALMFAVAFTSFNTAMTAAAATGTTWTQSLTPNSNIYTSIDLVYDSDWQSITGVMDLELVLADGTSHSLSLDPATMQVVGLSGQNTMWDDDSVRRWFVDVGLDINDPQVAAAARETSRVVDMTIMSPDNGYMLNLAQHTNTFTPTGAIVGAVPGPISPFSGYGGQALAMLVAAVLVYALGVALIVRRRGRLLRQFTTSTAPPTPPPSPT